MLMNAVKLATLLTSMAWPVASQAGITCSTVPRLMMTLLARHFSAHGIDSDVRKRAAEAYLRVIDPSRTLLLKGEAEGLRRDMERFIDEFQGRNCHLLTNVEEMVRRKTREIEDIVRRTVNAKGFAPDYTVALVSDPDKRGYAKDEAAFLELHRKLIHFQITNYLTAGTALAEARKQLVHRYELRTKWQSERTPEDTLDTFLDAFASALDPHTTYLSPRELSEFRIGMELSLDGIGAVLSSDNGYTVIEEIVPGGAADRAGTLVPKDKIVAVAQEGEAPVNVIDMKLSDVVRLIRGKRSTRVTLTVLRKHGDDVTRHRITLVRDKIDLKKQAAQVEYVTRKSGGRAYQLAVVELPSFYGGGDEGRSSYRDVLKLVKEVAKKGVDGMVLDLSRNGGGLLDDAVKISGIFLGKGPVVATVDGRRQVDLLRDEDPAIYYNGPIIVHTSKRSASGAEILAGALKDYRRAIVVGDDSTFGKGTVQVVLPLPEELGAIKVTSGMFFTPSGLSTQLLGVQSDVMLPSAYDTSDFGESSLPASLPAQQIAPFVGKDGNSTDPAHRWTPVTRTVVEALRARSTKRVAGSARFKEMKEKLAKAKAEDGIIRLSTVETELRERKKAAPTGQKGKKGSKKKGSKKKAAGKKEKGAADASGEGDQGGENDILAQIKRAEAALKDEALDILVDYVKAIKGGHR